MHVAITGGSGKLGRACVMELLAHEYEVRNLDLSPGNERYCPFIKVDFTDFGQTMEALSKVDTPYQSAARTRMVDAVVHLAAIPGPWQQSNSATFKNNNLSSVNVFVAARQVGIRTLYGRPAKRFWGFRSMFRRRIFLWMKIADRRGVFWVMHRTIAGARNLQPQPLKSLQQFEVWR